MANLIIETNLFEGKVNEDSSGRTIVKGVFKELVLKIKMVECTHEKF
jgi:hypothetical protein